MDQIFDHPPLYFGRVDDVTNALLPVHAKAVLDGTVRRRQGTRRPCAPGLCSRSIEQIADMARAETGRATAPRCSRRICSGRQLDLHRMYAAKAG